MWWPQRDSNPCFSLERAVSWASRGWAHLGGAAKVAGGGGFEPPLRGPEPRVLPLDDPPTPRHSTRRPLALSRQRATAITPLFYRKAEGSRGQRKGESFPEGRNVHALEPDSARVGGRRAELWPRGHGTR